MPHPLKSLALALAFAVIGSGTAMAAGAANCAARDRVLEKLQSNYGETRQSFGLGANNALVEVFASDETGTWTITVTTPGGQTCLVASGQAFENLDETLALGDDV